MEVKQRVQLVLFFLVFAALITLSCNFPKYVSDIFIGDNIFVRQKFQSEYDATLVSPEGEIISILPLNNYVNWVCEDINGELSTLIDPDGSSLIESFKYNKAFLEWNIIYNPEENFITITYKKDFDRDYPVIGVDGNIASWENDKWYGEFLSIGHILVENWSFNGSYRIEITQVDTFPEPYTGKREETHNYFGLISKNNIQQAYLCDYGVNPLPEGIDRLTAEDFQDHCQFYYYECSSK